MSSTVWKNNPAFSPNDKSLPFSFLSAVIFSPIISGNNSLNISKSVLVFKGLPSSSAKPLATKKFFAVSDGV